MRSSISGANNQGDGSSPTSAPPRMGMASSSPVYPCLPSSAATTSTESPIVQRIHLNHRSDRMILLKVHCLVRLALTGGYILSLPENSEL